LPKVLSLLKTFFYIFFFFLLLFLAQQLWEFCAAALLALYLEKKGFQFVALFVLGKQSS
jgi:hypothetical protein